MNAAYVFVVFTSSLAKVIGTPGTAEAIIESSADSVPSPAAFLA